VLSLHRSGALQKLIQVTQENKTDLLPIQEVRWLGRSLIEEKDCTVYYSCDDKQNIFGTGFIISKSIRFIIDFKSIDRRMCVFRIRRKFKNYSYIYAHVAKVEKSERRTSFMTDYTGCICNASLMI